MQAEGGTRMWKYEMEEEKLEPGTISDKVSGMNAGVYRPTFSSPVQS